MGRLEAKVAVITGAAAGLGRVGAELFAAEGARVVVADVVDGDEVVDTIAARGGEATYVRCDVTDEDAVAATVAHAVETFGGIDVRYNNAGVMLLSFMDKLKVAEWEQMIDLNFKGVLYGIAAVLPIMREQRGGHIVNLSSDADRKVFPGSAVYSATKAAVTLLSDGLRFELAREQMPIRVTSISAGAVTTELAKHITDKDIFDVFRSHPSIEFMKPADIAAAVMYAVTQPPHVDINNILLRPTQQAT